MNLYKGKVDVLLPIHREDEFLESSLKSVKESIGILTRIILIDNSPYGISSVKNHLRSKDIYIRETDLGFAKAMNAPIKQGVDFNEFVAYMNSDDTCHPLRLKNQTKLMYESKSDLCIANQMRIKRGKPYKSFFGNPGRKPFHPLFLAFGAYGADPTWVFRSELLSEMPLRDEDIHHDLVDLKLALQIFPKIKAIGTNEELYFYRSHGNQISNKMATPTDFSNILKLYEDFLSHWNVTPRTLETMYAIRPQDPKRLLMLNEETRHDAREFIGELRNEISKRLNEIPEYLRDFFEYRKSFVAKNNLPFLLKAGLEHILQL